jgi:CRP-like cAMP-binding protein
MTRVILTSPESTKLKAGRPCKLQHNQNQFRGTKDMLRKSLLCGPAADNAEEHLLSATLNELGTSHHCSAKIELFHQDSKVQDVFVLNRGLVKLIRVEEDGREMIVGLRSPDWILGAASAVSGGTHVVTAVSVTACRLRRISAKEFLEHLRSDLQLSWRLHKMHSGEIREQFARMSQLGNSSARHRLEYLLWHLDSTLKDDGTVQYTATNLPLKHWEIAQLIAVTPEHLSRLLKKMQQEGLIHT